MKLYYNILYSIIITFIIILIIKKLNNKESFVINTNINNTITYREFKNYYPKLHYLNLSNKNHIPKFIFRTSKFNLSDTPKEIKYILDKTLEDNPNYIQIYFNDNDIEDFIKDNIYHNIL